MEEANTEDWMGESADTFVFRSRPNQSLTHRQERFVFWGLAVLCLAAPSVFAYLGYWLMLPFAGLEIVVLAWVFKILRSRAGDYETLAIEGDTVVLEWHAGGREGRREMNRKWARLICECRTPGRNCRLGVSSHGRATAIGLYLNDKQRLKLAAALRSRFQA